MLPNPRTMCNSSRTSRSQPPGANPKLISDSHRANPCPRTDLVAVFLTGVLGVNQTNSNPALGEMLRLNTSIPVTPAAGQNVFGAALCFVNGELILTNPGCDPASFLNGWSPIDDIVDITLRVAMGYLLPPAQAPAGQLPFIDQTRTPINSFLEQDPNLRTPIPGALQ